MTRPYNIPFKLLYKLHFSKQTPGTDGCRGCLQIYSLTKHTMDSNVVQLSKHIFQYLHLPCINS